MSLNNDHRSQLVHAAMASGTGEGADVAVQLWQSLALRLTSLIGEGGFNALYARSRYLTHAAYPWVAPGDALRPADFRFAELKISLGGQSSAEANKASHMLLLTFTDILAALIGETLVTGILNSAWGDDAAAIAGREFSNE